MAKKSLIEVIESNKKVIDLASGLKPSDENRCKKCLNSAWFNQQSLNCKCLLIQAITWTNSGINIEYCTAADDLRKSFVKCDEKNLCEKCQNAIWYKQDSDRLTCFCSKLNRITYQDKNVIVNKKVSPVRACSIYQREEII